VAADDPGQQAGSLWGECLSFDNDRVDSVFLARCLRAHTESFVADIWPTPLAPNVVLVIADDMREDALPWMPKTLSAIALVNVDPPRGPNFREQDLSGKPGWVHFLQVIATATDAEAIEVHRSQLRSLLALDDAVGDVDYLLERLGLTDNTVVIFVSDQGILQGEHWSHTKFAAYEEVIRIPLSLRYPSRYPSPRSSDAMVITADIATTIASLAGVSIPQGRQGMNLEAVLAGQSTPRDHILIESSGGYLTYPNRAIRNDRWKLIASHPQNSPGNLRYELYDLEADRFELTNLYTDPAHATIANQLREALDSALPQN
jgi:hypothetical protein